MRTLAEFYARTRRIPFAPNGSEKARSNFSELQLLDKLNFAPVIVIRKENAVPLLI